MIFKSKPKTTDFTTEFVMFVDEADEQGLPVYLVEGSFPTELPVGFDYGIELDEAGGYYFKSSAGATYLNWTEE